MIILFNVRKHTEETKQKISQSLMGHVVGEETKKKLRGKRNVSIESHIAMSEAKKGKKQSKEHIEKVRLKNIGKKRTKEFCEQMRQLGKEKEKYKGWRDFYYNSCIYRT